MNPILLDIIVHEVTKLDKMGLSQNQISILKTSMTCIGLSSYELGKTGKLKDYSIPKNDDWDDESRFY